MTRRVYEGLVQSDSRGVSLEEWRCTDGEKVGNSCKKSVALDEDCLHGILMARFTLRSTLAITSSLRNIEMQICTTLAHAERSLAAILNLRLKAIVLVQRVKFSSSNEMLHAYAWVILNLTTIEQAND